MLITSISITTSETDDVSKTGWRSGEPKCSSPDPPSLAASLGNF